jgi:hypothetical protein
MEAFAIKVSGKAYDLYLRVRATEMSGYTRAIEEARAWHTREGAERWIAERGFRGEVVPVRLVRGLRGRLVPQAA